VEAMTKSKTYNLPEGMSYIDTSDLVYTKVYAVKRSGDQYDKYVSGDGNRKYIHEQSMGRVHFFTSGNPGGEKVFVIYKSTSPISTPIPGICEAVQIVSVEMPVGLVGQPYVYTVVLTGSRPFDLADIVAPSWAFVVPYGLNQARVYGTPDAESSTNVSFTVNNACGSAGFSRPLTILSGTVNFYVDDFLTAVVRRVENLPYILTSGNIPTNGPIPVEGVHTAYTGTIPVEVSGIVFPLKLRLYKNGVVLQLINVPANGFYTFTSESFLASDEIKITLST
jgi:hypothetical protein